MPAELTSFVGRERALEEIEELLGQTRIWTLSAAEKVCAGDGIGEDEILDLLSCLVDKSLVVVARGNEDSRYRMLETVRQYASEKLAESAEDATARARHANYFLVLAEEAKIGLAGPNK